jgi:hypothetical protein
MASKALWVVGSSPVATPPMPPRPQSPYRLKVGLQACALQVEPLLVAS